MSEPEPESSSASTATKTNEEQESLTLTAQLAKAETLLNNTESPTPPGTTANTQELPVQKAIHTLEKLQEQIQRCALFSKNESLDDVPTSSIGLLATEYHLAKAYLQLPTTPLSNDGTGGIATQRRKLVSKALEYFQLFLERCHDLDGLLQDSISKDYLSSMTASEEQLLSNEYSADDDGPSNTTARLPPPSRAATRDSKIARYRQTQSLKQTLAQQNALLSQRRRLNLSAQDEMEGYDEDSLRRSLVILTINYNALDALDEAHNSVKEMEMLNMAVKMEKERGAMSRYSGASTGRHGPQPHQHNMNQNRRQYPQSNEPLRLTHVTQNSTTGQLIMRKEEIRSNVFRPSWNQPTMTLDELAEREVADAMERSERQKLAEEEAKKGPRRYEQLVRDGMEDDADLVDQSAVLDRKWDDWKDDNPRGSGNKMADVGDRNF